MSEPSKCEPWFYFEMLFDISSHISVYGSASLADLGRVFTLLIRTQSVLFLEGGSAATYTQNKGTQRSTSRVGFEPTTPVFYRAKTIHALDYEATVTANHHISFDETVI
jgi:hypothetical protein